MVDSVQSLLHSPGILVCVGHEPFHPLLLDRFQSNSDDKLPKLVLKSQSNICNEAQGYKKNARSGLKSKKSIPPGPFPKARENMVDDDIEKCLLVNKDGSLSMEMKVRFRMLNDKTLHCSTDIKKSSCTFNVSFPVQDNVYYPQCGHGESCSEVESLSASEADDIYITDLYQKHFEEPHCQHCCTHCQEYDIWKNAALSEQETLRHSESTKSSAPSQKIKCKKESVDSVHTTSCEEYTEQVLEKVACIQSVEDRDKGDNTDPYCTISRCCSRSEVCSVSTKAQKAGYIDEKYRKTESTHTFTEDEKRTVPYKNVKQGQISVQNTQVSTEDERPFSVETNSSDILASLKEDEDNEETDLSPSNSRASQRNKEKQTRNPVLSPYSFTPCNPPESPKQSLSLRTSSTASCCSVKFKTSRKVVVTEIQENVDQAKNNTPSPTPNKESTDATMEKGTSEEKLEASNQSVDDLDKKDTGTDMRALKSASDFSKMCDDISDDIVETYQTNEKGRSSAMSTTPNPHADLTISSTCVVAEQQFVDVKDPLVGYESEEENIEAMPYFTSADSDTAECLVAKIKTEEPADVTSDEKVVSAMSPESDVSAQSSQSRLSEVACKERKKAELQEGEITQSVISVHSNASTISEQSVVSELLANETEDETEEVMPRALSKVSGSSQVSDLETPELREMEKKIEDRFPTIMSGNSSISEAIPVKHVKVQLVESVTSALSTKTNTSVQSITSKPSEGTSVDIDNKLLRERVPSVMSAKSDVSVTASILDLSPHTSDVEEEAIQGHAPTAKSSNSNTSSRSNTSKISRVSSKEADAVEEERLKRPSSVMSSKSAASERSMKCKKDDNTVEKTKQLQDEYISVMTSKPSDSELSKKSKTSEAALEQSGKFEDNSEEQASSTTSTKSNSPSQSNNLDMFQTGILGEEERSLSSMSSKSNVSKKSEKEESPASIMSSTSVKCKNSVVSNTPCENEQEEAKQTGRRSQNAFSVRSRRCRKSQASEAPRQDPGDEGNRERTPSATSCKSILSNRSNFAPDGVHNKGSAEDLLKETESAYEETKDERATSAMSSLSNTSKDLNQQRAPTSMSTKSNVSRESTNSKMEQSKDECEENLERTSILASPSSTVSARSKKSESLAAVPPAKVKNQSKERSQTVISVKSNTPQTLEKNTDLFCLKEAKKAKEGELVEGAPSAISSTYNTSVRSKRSDKQSNRPMEKIHLSTNSPKSSTSSKDEKSNSSAISNNSPNVDAVKSEETWDIKMDERAPSDMSTKSSASSRSVESNISSLAGAQTGILSSNEGSDSVLSDLKSKMLNFMSEMSHNAENEERASSALNIQFCTSSVHNTERASTSVSIGIVEEYDVDNAEEDNSVSLASVHSISKLNSKTDVCGKDSSKMIENKNQQCMQTPDDRTKSSVTAETIVSDKSKKSERMHKKSSQPISDNDVANNKSAKKNSKNSSSHSLSNRSAHSDFRSSKTPDRNSSLVTDRPKSNMSNTLLHLEVNTDATCSSVCELSKSNLSSDRYSKKDKEEISRPHSDVMSVTSVLTDKSLLRQKSNEPIISLGVSNHESSPSKENGNKLNTTRDVNVCGRTCNGSLVATECSGNVNANKRGKNSICTHSSTTLAQKIENNPSKLVPSILPSSSPTEVVNEWLKTIPLDSALYDVDDEFHESCEEEELLKVSGKETQYERDNISEGDAGEAVLRPEKEQLGVEEIGNNESIQPCTFPDVPPDVQLMRILLSPKLDRCNSLPEVSTVYRRKLSTSARGFLDSLVNLQLLDFDPSDVNGKAEKYNDVMNMLQSLWLCEPSDRVTITQKSTFNYQCSNAEEFNIKSYSGVDINSSSQDSGKSNVNESTVTQRPQTNTHTEGIEILTNVQEIDKTEKAFKGVETKSDSATPDIASRVRWTPDNEAEENMPGSNIFSAISDVTIRNDYSPRESPDTASISNKSSGNDSNANASSESPSSQQMTRLTENVSQDSDPVWVLKLLNKIEKQFMTHYVTAMDELKVRWNLNDNEQLDVMIHELRDEVHKRIQASINNELRQIQGPAGRPRPPKESTSRESITQRHRRLKVNHNQSIAPAVKTDDDNAAILMTDFTDQQNDEYYPFDICMKKKASSKPVLATKVSCSARAVIDFDLRKIPHLKVKPPSNSKENMKANEIKEQFTEMGNLTENVLLESFMKDKTQGLSKANLELHSKSTEQKQNESDTSNDKGFGKEDSQAQGVRKESSCSSSEEDASDTQSNKFEQLNDQPMKDGNSSSRAVEKESPIAGGELRDHVELKKVTEILSDSFAEEENAEYGDYGEYLETPKATIAKYGKISDDGITNIEGADDAVMGKGEIAEDKDDDEILSDSAAEDENAQSGPADMGTEGKITEDEEEVCTDETVREVHTIQAGAAKENMALEVGTVGEQDVPDGESTDGKGTEVETSGDEMGDETAKDQILDKTDSMGERTSEDNEEEEGEISESEPEKGAEIPDDEKEKYDDAKTETTWKNMLTKPDIAVELESTAAEEPEVEHKSDGIKDPDGTDEDDTLEEEKSESRRKNEERDANESAEEDVAIKKLSRKSYEVDLFDEEKINETTEDGYITEHESAEWAHPMNDKSAKEGERDSDELDAEGKTTKAERAADEGIDDNETAEYREKFYDDTSDSTEIIKIKTTEDRDIKNNVTTEDGETTGVKVADVEEAGETKATDDGDYESSEDAETSKTAENASDDETAEYGETPKATIAEDGQISDDGITNDEGADDAVMSKAEIAEDKDTDDDEISEIEEMPRNETVDSGITAKDKATEYEETHEGDGKSEDGQAAGEGKTADQRASDETAEDAEMDTSQSEEDGETTDNEVDNRERPNGNTADDVKEEDEKPPESDMEEVDETTEAETAEDGEQEDDGSADGRIGDNEFTDEATTGSENEDKEETAETETGEDGETAESGRTEDGDTADERKEEDEELSENEIDQNGEIAKGTIEEHGQTDESESLENGETAGEVNREIHESSTADGVINTHDINKETKLRDAEYKSRKAKMCTGSEADDGEDLETDVNNKDGGVENEEDD